MKMEMDMQMCSVFNDREAIYNGTKIDKKAK